MSMLITPALDGFVAFGLDGTGSTPDPYDLAEAIDARYKANAATVLVGIYKVYESQAGDKPTTPYVIYQIRNGPLLFSSDTIRIYNHRVTFTAHADNQQAANRARDAIDAAYKVGPFPFTSGISWPFFEENRAEGKMPGRAPGLTLNFTASIEYSARTERSP